MNIKRTIVLLGATAIISVPLVFSTPAEAKGGYGPHKSEQGHRNKHHRPGKKEHYQRYSHGRDHRRHNRHHRRHDNYNDSYRSYGYYRYPHSHYYGGGFALGLVWPYGFTFYYED